MRSMKHIIMGMGEVGKAIHSIFPEAETYDPKTDQSKECADEYQIIHVCFPCVDQEKFIYQVKSYRDILASDLIIVHSTVPIGTCEKIGKDAVHSPVRGKHPDLIEGLKTFVKYFGGPRASEASHLFFERGINTLPIENSRTTEALKLWDTTQYGAMILLEKEIYKFCEDNRVDFNIVYSHANATYNHGYKKLGLEQVSRPFLNHKDGKIGGHCVVENAAFLDSPTAKRIVEENKSL